MGASLWPSIQAYIERTAEQARAVLGDAVFQQAWTSGALLSVDQAVAMAMALREPPQPSDVSRTSKGLRPLTLRELAVARLIARGLTNKQIAACLVIAEGTADRHVANILDKLGFNSRAQIAAWTVEHAAATGA
jgi:non-specific serine/threonine protein kinase